MDLFFLSSVCYAFVRVFLYVPCGHLLTSCSRLWCLTVSLSLSNWYLGMRVDIGKECPGIADGYILTNNYRVTTLD